jgi:hypothetical protein
VRGGGKTRPSFKNYKVKDVGICMFDNSRSGKLGVLEVSFVEVFEELLLENWVGDESVGGLKMSLGEMLII